jgi:hypothetical protein
VLVASLQYNIQSMKLSWYIADDVCSTGIMKLAVLVACVFRVCLLLLAGLWSDNFF